MSGYVLYTKIYAKWWKASGPGFRRRHSSNVTYRLNVMAGILGSRISFEKANTLCEKFRPSDNKTNIRKNPRSTIWSCKEFFLSWEYSRIRKEGIFDHELRYSVKWTKSGPKEQFSSSYSQFSFIFLIQWFRALLPWVFQSLARSLLHRSLSSTLNSRLTGT